MPDSDFSPDPIRWDRYPSLAEHGLARKHLVIEAALGLARNTLDAYGRAREDFFRFCVGHQVGVSEASREEVALWIRDLMTRPVSRHRGGAGSGLANASIHQKVTAVRLFFDFLIEQGKRGTNPVGHAPGRIAVGKRGLFARQRTLPWIPSDDEWHAIAQIVAGEPIRNRLMFCLAYDAALRREELCNLLISDFDFANRVVRVRAIVAKGKRERVVPYSPTSAALIPVYLKHRRNLSMKAGPAFLSESRRNAAQPLSIWTWSKVVSARADA